VAEENLREKRFKKSASIVARKVAEEFILVPIRKRSTDLGSIYALNPVGAFVWECIDGSRKIVDIRDAVVGEFDVVPEVAEKDVLELIGELLGIGALDEV